MPTGYTYGVTEKDWTFEQFVLECARAFGALIEMRDEPGSTPIPQEIKANTEYHDESIAKAQRELNALHALTVKAKIEYSATEKQATISSIEGSIAKRKMDNAKFQVMLDHVQLWTPPTPDHEEMKKFMIQQLETSMDSADYWEKELEKVRAKPLYEWFTGAVDGYLYSLKSHTEDREKAIARAKDRNEWLQNLRKSLI